MSWVVPGVIAVAVFALWHWNRAAIAELDAQASLVAQDGSGVRSLVAQGRLVAAIRLTRRLTGRGLKGSKELVDAIQRGESVDFAAPPGAGVTGLLVAAKDAEIRRLLSQGEKISAIRRWRILTGGSLADAHDAVETLARGLPRTPGSFPE